jgi:uncharacterized membrane protein
MDCRILFISRLLSRWTLRRPELRAEEISLIGFIEDVWGVVVIPVEGCAMAASACWSITWVISSMASMELSATGGSGTGR